MGSRDTGMSQVIGKLTRLGYVGTRYSVCSVLFSRGRCSYCACDLKSICSQSLSSDYSKKRDRVISNLSWFKFSMRSQDLSRLAFLRFRFFLEFATSSPFVYPFNDYYVHVYVSKWCNILLESPTTVSCENTVFLK